MTHYGLTNCKTCDREYETSLTDGSYVIEGRTKREHYADQEECDFCRGEKDCDEEGCNEQATILDTDIAVLYCAKHWKQCCEENGDTVEECEEYVLRLEESRHAKSKGGK